MDPFVLGLLALAGSAAAVAARWRRVSRENSAQARALPAPGTSAATVPNRADPPGDVRTGDVLTYLGESYWLAGELRLMRDGAVVLRLFIAPEKGGDRWLAIPRDARSVWLLREEPELSAMGWPGVEAPVKGRTLRREEQGSIAIAPSGEAPTGWEGMGRYAVLRAHDTVAVVLEGTGKSRLALTGKEIPRGMIEKMG